MLRPMSSNQMDSVVRLHPVFAGKRKLFVSHLRSINRFYQQQTDGVVCCVRILRSLSRSICIVNTAWMFILVRRMTQSVSTGRAMALGSYEESVRALNSLQSNLAYLTAPLKRGNSLQETKKYLIRSGLSLEHLDRLSIIHVAGTKGKGSTCAFTEAILREHGFRTGFFSSPHLISVRERFRINGRTISEMEFLRHFWPVYNTLYQKKETESDMPSYFRFLTILMFHIFLKANIDVAILEVGIGGEHDCTNIINSSTCTAITSLGLDHTNILGDTIESIAYQKSGIFRSGTPAFTVQQSRDAMLVLQNRAREKNCSLSLVPSLDSYPWRMSTPTLGIRSIVQKENASLAIQLASAWITRHNNIRNRQSAVLAETENKININGSRIINNGTYCIKDEPSQKKKTLNFEKVANALSSCKWPGRTQVMLGKTMDFYIDGAHTKESMECCISWFENIIANSGTDRIKYLIFNITGNRNTTEILLPLKKIGFRKAFFVPNVSNATSSIVDQKNYNNTVSMQVETCQRNADLWGDNAVLASSVYEALAIIRNDKNANSISTINGNSKPQVLVTGSLHLAGALLAIIDPDLTMSTKF